MQGTSVETGVEPLVSVEWLAANLDRPELRIFDCTSTLVPDPEKTWSVRNGLEDWTREHIPGSGYLDIQGELSDPNSAWRFSFPGADTLGRTLAGRGIGDDSHVVLYSIASPVWATRVWWMLRAIGFDRALVLDGGLTSWKAAGHETSDGPCTYPAAENLTIHPRPGLMVDADEVMAALRSGQQVVNALSREQHAGGGVSYGRPGRIAGSCVLPTAETFEPGSTAFLPLSQIGALMKDAGIDPDAPITAYCGGGIAASATCFNLVRLGARDVALYDNSLSEWVTRPELPMETGE